jgi:Protein of unknown function (DUF2569)
MDHSELEALRQRYRAWSTEDLVRAVTIDIDQYNFSAVELMKRELDERNIPQSEREALQASSAEKSEEQIKSLSGIKGLLLLFVLVVLGNSAYIVLTVLISFVQYTNLAVFIVFALLLTVGAYGLFVFNVLIRRNPSAPRHATNWVIIMPIMNVLYAVVGYLTGEEMPGGVVNLVRSAMFSVIWLTYLPHSKRVAATYGRGA